MSTSRLADLRVRAAASQAVGLDVRGPVSQALGRAGITVPPAPLAETGGGTAAPEPATTTTARRTRPEAAPRVVKPFKAAPWPTTRRAERAPGPPASLSGLTADERRVHRILLDTLALENTRMDRSDGLSYAEKKRLETLDVTFIDAEIAAMERQRKARAQRTGVGTATAALLVPLVIGLAVATGANMFSAITLCVLVVALVLKYRYPARGQRLAIYHALRELALLTNSSGVTSDALAQADAVIDRLTDADDVPRLRLNDASTPSASGAPRRARARS